MVEASSVAEGLIPPDPAHANDPASFPALRGIAPASLLARAAARAADVAVVFCWWALAVSGGAGAVAAAIAFVAAMALLLVRAQTPGEALLGLVALDVQTGRPAPGAAFVKVLVQLMLIVGSLGMGLVALAATTRGPLRRNLADRATGLIVASLRSGTGSEEWEGEPAGWASAVQRARWDGPAMEEEPQPATSDVLAVLQVTTAGVRVRAAAESVVIATPGGGETRLTPGDGAPAMEGATIRSGELTLRVERC